MLQTGHPLLHPTIVLLYSIMCYVASVELASIVLHPTSDLDVYASQSQCCS